MGKGNGMPDGRMQRMIAPEDRARQFMPFAALKGYYDLVRERERVPEPRRELTEEHAAFLSEQVAALKKGDMVKVTHYDGEAYATTEGVLTGVDVILGALTIVKTHVSFGDIWEIEFDPSRKRGL